MKIIAVVIIKYKPMLVKDNCILPNRSAFMVNRFLIINWSNGLLFEYIHYYVLFCLVVLILKYITYFNNIF